MEFAPGGKERLALGLARLAEQSRETRLVDKLAAVLERGDGFLVSRLQPYVLAAEWAAPRRAVLELCLRATRAGLLDLQWDIMCPLCRGAKETDTHLAGVKPRVHCDTCNIDFSANFERSCNRVPRGP